MCELSRSDFGFSFGVGFDSRVGVGFGSGWLGVGFNLLKGYVFPFCFGVDFAFGFGVGCKNRVGGAFGFSFGVVVFLLFWLLGRLKFGVTFCRILWEILLTG